MEKNDATAAGNARARSFPLFYAPRLRRRRRRRQHICKEMAAAAFLPSSRPLPLQSGWLPRSFPLFIHVRGAPIVWPRGGREFVSPEQCNCAMCMIHRASRNRTGGTKKPPLHADLAPSASQPCSKEDGREDRGRRKLNRKFERWRSFVSTFHSRRSPRALARREGKKQGTLNYTGRPDRAKTGKEKKEKRARGDFQDVTHTF